MHVTDYAAPRISPKIGATSGIGPNGYSDVTIGPVFVLNRR